MDTQITLKTLHEVGMIVVVLLVVLLGARAVAQTASPPSPHLTLTASVASASSFRLSVRTTAASATVSATASALVSPPAPLPSPSLWSEASPAPFHRAHRDSDGADGVITDFGSLWVLADGKGWELLDAANMTLVGGGLPTLGEVTGLTSIPAVLLPVTKTFGNTLSQGESRSALGEPCLGNGKFEAPWYVDDQSGAFAFIVAAAREGSRPECAPLAFRAPQPRQDKCANPILKHDATTGDRVTQYANLTMKECCASCNKNTLVRVLCMFPDCLSTCICCCTYQYTLFADSSFPFSFIPSYM